MSSRLIFPFLSDQSQLPVNTHYSDTVTSPSYRLSFSLSSYFLLLVPKIPTAFCFSDFNSLFLFLLFLNFFTPIFSSSLFFFSFPFPHFFLLLLSLHFFSFSITPTSFSCLPYSSSSLPFFFLLILDSPIRSLNYSLSQVLVHSFILFLTLSFNFSLTHTIIPSLTCSLSHSLSQIL